MQQAARRAGAALMSKQPRIDEMRRLQGFAEKRAEFKKTYFVVPDERVSWTAIPTALLESDVWKALGINERRFVDAILIVYARSGGRKNGLLVLTHKQLKQRGIDGNRIKPTIANLVAFRLLEVTHKGGPADPARYRVTFLPHQIVETSGRIANYPPGNEWIEIELEIIAGNRVSREKRHKIPARKADFQRWKSPPVSGAQFPSVDEPRTSAPDPAQGIDLQTENADAKTKQFLSLTRLIR
jgi:hypothetical protein